MERITENAINNSPSNCLTSKAAKISLPSPANYMEVNGHE